jgi:hypothetical protein
MTIWSRIYKLGNSLQPCHGQPHWMATFTSNEKENPPGGAQSGKIDRTTANIGDHLATFLVCPECDRK